MALVISWVLSTTLIVCPPAASEILVTGVVADFLISLISMAVVSCCVLAKTLARAKVSLLLFSSETLSAAEIAPAISLEKLASSLISAPGAVVCATLG